MSNRKYDLASILAKLNEFGLNSEECERVMSDITNLVEMKIASFLASNLSEEAHQILSTGDDSKIKDYFSSNPDVLPKLSLEKIFSIEDSVWDEYFDNFKK